MRILYLDLDALNPRHLSCYGYQRQTSPTIDALASQGIQHTNVYCSDAPCLPSRTAFYQGRFGIQTGVVGHAGTAADPKRQGADRDFMSCYETQSLPFQLQQAGYHTAMVSPFGQRHAAHQFYAGFNEIHNTGRGGMESAHHVMPTVNRWLTDHASDDQWYLHINFWDIHTPYRAPQSYGNPFENEPLPDYFTDELIARHAHRSGPHSAQDLGMYSDAKVEQWPRLPLRVTDRRSMKQWIDGYDTAIRYVDDQIALIVAQLKAAGVYDDTAIIVSADHGENQIELGIYGEHPTADQGTCRIPFIVKWPGSVMGHVDQTLHYHLDWAPTLMTLLGKSDQIPELWDGQTFDTTLTQGAVQGRDQLVLSQCCHVCQRSVRFDEGQHHWLYIRTYHDGFHPFPKHQLFDLAADPFEQDDLAPHCPTVVRDATFRLMDWHDQQMAQMTRHASDSIDPMWTVIREGGPRHARLRSPGDPGSEQGLLAYIHRLEQTGRSDGAQLLRQHYVHSTTPDS